METTKRPVPVQSVAGAAAAAAALLLPSGAGAPPPPPTRVYAPDNAMDALVADVRAGGPRADAATAVLAAWAPDVRVLDAILAAHEPPSVGARIRALVAGAPATRDFEAAAMHEAVEETRRVYALVVRLAAGAPPAPAPPTPQEAAARAAVARDFLATYMAQQMTPEQRSLYKAFLDAAAEIFRAI